MRGTEKSSLSQWFPLEFSSTNYISQEKERRQVEGHLRICLKIDAVFETMTTISSSELILSEAAYFVMQKPSFNAPRALKLVMEGFSVSKGDHGEFLVLLLLTLARDTTVGAANGFGRPMKGKRWFCLTDFLHGQVFPTNSSPAVNEGSICTLAMLLEDFPNAQLHFTHFVKVLEHKAIDITSLFGTKLARDNAGLILYQIKNDSSYSAKPQLHLFNAMDPYNLDILEKDMPPVPLIKVVFALAARTPALNIVHHGPTEKYNAVIYEIWCAGISPDILGPVEQQQVGIWDSLLQASYGWKELYKATSQVTADLRRSEIPGAARDAAHYSCWVKRP